MRWTRGGTSRDIEDRRGRGPIRGPGGFRGLGLGGVVVLLVLSVVFKQDLLSVFGTDLGTGDPGGETAAPAASTPAEDSMVAFVSFVLDSAQSFWARTLEREGGRYEHAQLVLFRDAVESACGLAESATGPFYCPGDGKVFIDLGFYDELSRRFGAPGDFAQAYVLAHEIGHHVQNLLGIERQVRARQSADPEGANQVQVRMELQADCLAGVWGHEAERLGILEAGDVEEGMGAAAAVGDDRLQKMATGRVNPDSFTHGSSESRVRWFLRGFQSGAVSSCDTFSGPI